MAAVLLAVDAPRVVPPNGGPLSLYVAQPWGTLEAIFIRYYVEMPYPRAVLEEALLRAPESLIPSLAVLADDRGRHLLAEVGFDVRSLRVSKHVEMEIGKASMGNDRTWIPISWRATGPAGLFPALEGELELAALGTGQTQLSLSGRYQPPLGLVGRTIDKALLSRIAEGTIKDFIDRLALAIEAGVTANTPGTTA